MKHLAILLCAALATAASAQAAPAPERTSTLRDQRSVNLTVYNGSNALVHDRRRIVLDAGRNAIAWRDVSAKMDPTSAILSALDPGSQVGVIEQNFDYDVLNQASLLRKYVGSEVIVVHPARFAGERPRREWAKVLNVDDGIVLQYRDRVETQLDGYIEFPRVPPSLRDRPTLTVDLQSARRGPQTLDLAYLTDGLSWSANYVATIAADRAHMNLLGFVSLTNDSGTSYSNARLQLVAGNVQTTPPHEILKTIARVTASQDVFNVNAQQEDLFEYHLYTIPFRTTILDKQTKQLALLSASDVPIRETLELHGSEYYSRATAQGDIGARLPVGIYVSFDNKGEHLGIPLPAGTMRMYQNDSHGLSQFLGASSIPHTPRNDTVRLYLGDAFDVVAHKVQTDFKLHSNCSASSSYAIALVNGKNAPQEVRVIEPIPGDWSISQPSLPYRKSSAHTATWIVTIPADATTTLRYTADVTWCRE